MSDVTFVTCMQNSRSSGQALRFLSQVEHFANALPQHTVRVVVSEGDSRDDTRKWLQDYLPTQFEELTVADGHTGTFRVHGHVVTKARFKQFAYAANRALDLVPIQSDVLIIVESDILWDPDTLNELVKLVERDPAIYAPIPMTPEKGYHRLYDTWAFRAPGGGAFSIPPRGPYPWSNEPLTAMDSVGTCLVLPAGYYRMPEEDVVVGFCRNWREKGGKIFACGWATVIHP